MDHENDAEVARISELLRTAIRLAGRSNRDVERALGISAGYLSRLFAGAIELRVEHVLDIAGAIELDPGEFFRLALPAGPEPASPAGKKLLDLVSRIRGTPPVLQPPAPPSADQLEHMVRGAVRAVFAELAAPPARS